MARSTLLLRLLLASRRRNMFPLAVGEADLTAFAKVVKFDGVEMFYAIDVNGTTQITESQYVAANAGRSS